MFLLVLGEQNKISVSEIFTKNCYTLLLCTEWYGSGCFAVFEENRSQKYLNIYKKSFCCKAFKRYELAMMTCQVFFYL